jgi:Arc/MetJ family transcription regulator
MRTNIEIDDTLMAAAMEAGGFKTKKEAVEEGLRLVRRRKVYEGLLALRGKLQWDDSDEAWARVRAEDTRSPSGQEPTASYAVQRKSSAGKKAKLATPAKPAAAARSKRS